MFKSDKRYPAMEDTDLMPFGEHQGKLMQDVPARYLVWLHEHGGSHNLRVSNYIHNSLDALKQEIGDRE